MAVALNIMECKMCNLIKNFIKNLFFKCLPHYLSKLPQNYAAFFLWKLVPLKVVKNNDASPFVFVISGAAFTKDIGELIKKKSLNFIIMNQKWSSIIFLTHLAKYPHFFNHFFGAQEKQFSNLDIAVTKSVQLFESFLDKVEENVGYISSVLHPTFNQGGAKLINEYAKKKNKKVFCFHYEHGTIPMANRMGLDCYTHYKCKSPGGLLLIWHQSMKEMLLNSCFAFSKDIVISGAPRLNRWYDIVNRPANEKKYITLLSFPGDDYYAPLTYIDISLIFREMAGKYKDYNFVIKCKDSWHISQTLRILNNDIGNLTLSADIDMVDLLSQSKVVIGFNSLSFLEALLSQSHLILPYWGDSKHDPYLLQVDPQDPEAQEIIDVSYSREHFAELLERRMNEQVYQGDMQKRIAYLNKYIYFDENNKSVDIFEKVLLGSYGQN